VTGHWAVRDLVARPIGEPLAPIPEMIELLETIKQMELEDTSPEDYFALPQPVVPTQTMQQHLDSFQIYLDERRAQDEADARLADFATAMCDTNADVNSSVSVSTKQTKSCLPSSCPAPILSVPCPLYSHNKRQESALPNSQYVVSVRESAHLLVLWSRLKSAQAGSTPTWQSDQARPSCEYIHCSCHRCNVYRAPQGSWRDAPCFQRVGCSKTKLYLIKKREREDRNSIFTVQMMSLISFEVSGHYYKRTGRPLVSVHRDAPTIPLGSLCIYRDVPSHKPPIKMPPTTFLPHPGFYICILYILQETARLSVCARQVRGSILRNFFRLVAYLCRVVSLRQ